MRGTGEEEKESERLRDVIVERRCKKAFSSRGDIPMTMFDGERRGNEPREDDSSSSTDRTLSVDCLEGVERMAIGRGVRAWGVAIAAVFHG